MEAEMVKFEYHKGQECVFKPLLCQEGFCSDCFIYLEKLRPTKPSLIEEIEQFTFKRKILCNSTSNNLKHTVLPKKKPIPTPIKAPHLAPIHEFIR